MTTTPSSGRSQLIDYTYEHINLVLSGDREDTTPEQIAKILESRLDKLKQLSEPFKKPSTTSKKKIDEGSVTLPDGVIIHVDEADKDAVHAVSSRFQIDQIDALVLLRSFMYNEGLPTVDDPSLLIEGLLESITPFYFSERLQVVRVFIGLLRARSYTGHPFSDISGNLIDKVVNNAVEFASSVIAGFLSKTELAVPESVAGNPRSGSQWAKQNAREQLVLVEVLFWLLWDYVPRHATITLRVFEAAYQTEFGHRQENATLLLDSEGTQLLSDIASVWILVTVEVLGPEDLVGGALELPISPSDSGPLIGCPAAIEKIHTLVLSHTSPGYVCTFLAWAFFLKATSDAASQSPDRASGYANILKEIRARREGSYVKGEELHSAMVTASLGQETGFFEFLTTLLTESPLFATAAARKTGSALSFSNQVEYRAVLKGLIIALVEYQPVEYIPDFNGLVEACIALFGKSEGYAVTNLCRLFWDHDWRSSPARRAIVDATRSRFPIQFRPLVRLLCALTGAGAAEINAADDGPTSLGDERQLCSGFVYHYMRRLPTYTQILSVAARTGPNALYDRIVERPAPGSSSSSGGAAYINLRPVKLPGGSVLPARSIGRLLCSDSATEPVVVAWQHEHNGWKVLHEVLIHYICRRHGSSKLQTRGDPGCRRAEQVVTLQLEDIGLESTCAEEDLITDVLELVLSIVQDNPQQIEELMASLEDGGSVVSYTARDMPAPDLVQLIIMILEDSLSRSQSSRSVIPPPLIAPALSVLSALLSLPKYSNRVWLYLRSTTVLFGSSRNTNFTSAVLAAERISGHFPMTLALLRLVRGLFEEALSSLLSTQAEEPRLQAVKNEVLLRALRFVHNEIWVEHAGWRYARLGDRFDIGRHVALVYSRVFDSMSAVASASVFAELSAYVLEVLLEQATTATINPLVNIVATGRSLLKTLMGLRRLAEVRQLLLLLEVGIRLIRLILNVKQTSPLSAKLSLLEQILCTDVSIGNSSLNSKTARVNAIDALAGYIKEKDVDVEPKLALEAIRTLSVLCKSLSLCSPSAPTIVSHLSDAQGTVAALVRVARNPYDDLRLRNAVWTFICLAVDKEPALAGLFVAGQFQVPAIKGKGTAKQSNTEEKVRDSTTKTKTAVEVACETLANWKDLWDANPRLLASVMRFLDVTWHHGLEHWSMLQETRANKEFWASLGAIIFEELGPLPEYATSNHVRLDDGEHSNMHEAASTHAYRTVVKAHALHVIGSDMSVHAASRSKVDKPASYKAIESIFKDLDGVFADCISEVISSSYDPEIHDKLVEGIKTSFVPLNVDSLRSHEPLQDREFGDNFMFSVPLLQDLLRLNLENGENASISTEALQYLVYSVNLNLSLAHAQLALVESWHFLLQHVRGHLRGDDTIRSVFLKISASVARDVASEKRSGDMMSAVHGARLSLLLGLLEVVWFNPSETKDQAASFMTLMGHLDGIVTSETFPPGKSFLGITTTPFHRPLLQIIYFCGKSCRRLVSNPKILPVDYRVIMGGSLTAALVLVIDALRLTFDTASTRLDGALDKDMELLVAVFEQCTRPGLHTSSTTWLTRCQETDVIQASLKLLEKTDLVGVSDLASLRSRGQPLYSPHILLFHMALTTVPFAAERLASEGVVAAYSHNSITSAASIGAIDTTLPEFPGERSPAHRAYCMMLANVAGVTSALTSPHHFIDSQLVGFVQLFGKQISRALSWNNDEPVTLPFLEELEVTVELFYLMADGSTAASRGNGPTSTILRVFTNHALQLLQHLNYALTHPKHLAGLLEPVTAEERTQIERETADVSVNALSELIDPSKRPLLIRVIRRLFDVANKVLSTLIILSGAENVLISDPEEWSLQESLIVPHSKVTIGEPASIGTLLELGNCAHDILRFLVHNKAPLPSNGSGWAPLDVKHHARAARQLLESVLVYTTTQLVMWLAKNDGEHPGEMDLDDQQQEGHRAELVPLKDRDRRLKRKSLSLADRLRRGMTGEMSMDLQTLIAKSKATVIKSTDILGRDYVDLTPVLGHFLEERVVTPQ